jgi:hypothetical protein
VAVADPELRQAAVLAASPVADAATGRAAEGEAGFATSAQADGAPTLVDCATLRALIDDVRGRTTMRPLCRCVLPFVMALAAWPLHAAEYFISDRRPDALVAALHEANASPGPDRIHLARGGLYALRAATERDLLLPTVRGRLEILGHGAELRRSSPDALALLEIAPGAALRLERLTLAEGGRGSVRNHGVLSLDETAIVDTTTHSESAIVVNHGRLEATRSLIGYNQVAGAGRDAAIVLNYGYMHLVDTRIEGNSLSRRYPSLAAAPIVNFGELRADGVAIEGNDVIDGHGGLMSKAVLNLGIGRLTAIGASALTDATPP